MCVCVYEYMYVCGCVGVCRVCMCVPHCVNTRVTYVGVSGVNVYGIYVQRVKFYPSMCKYMCGCASVHVWVGGAVRCCVCVSVCIRVPTRT